MAGPSGDNYVGVELRIRSARSPHHVPYTPRGCSFGEGRPFAVRIPENPECNVPSMLMLLSLLVGAALVAEDLSDRSFAELLLRPNAMPTRFVRRHPAAGEHHRLHGQ